MINNEKLIIEFKSLAKVLSPKQRRKLIAKGSKHKDYSYIVDSFQAKIDNSVLELEDIYSYVDEFGCNDENTLDPAKLFLLFSSIPGAFALDLIVTIIPSLITAIICGNVGKAIIVSL